MDFDDGYSFATFFLTLFHVWDLGVSKGLGFWVRGGEVRWAVTMKSLLYNKFQSNNPGAGEGSSLPPDSNKCYDMLVYRNNYLMCPFCL